MTHPALPDVDAVKHHADIDDDRSNIALEHALGSAIGELRRHTGRTWEISTGTPTARVFTAKHPMYCDVDDFTSADLSDVVIKTRDTRESSWVTWTAAQWDIEPANGIWNGEPGWPYFEVLSSGRTRLFPTGRQLVQVTADWGWSTIPDPVFTGVILQTIHLWKREDSPDGTRGWDGLGAVIRVSPRIDPDAERLWSSYRRVEV